MDLKKEIGNCLGPYIRLREFSGGYSPAEYPYKGLHKPFMGKLGYVRAM